jgi:hypothetical protein
LQPKLGRLDWRRATKILSIFRVQELNCVGKKSLENCACESSPKDAIASS